MITIPWQDPLTCPLRTWMEDGQGYFVYLLMNCIEFEPFDGAAIEELYDYLRIGRRYVDERWVVSRYTRREPGDYETPIHMLTSFATVEDAANAALGLLL